jgi:hypothetical protein
MKTLAAGVPLVVSSDGRDQAGLRPRLAGEFYVAGAFGGRFATMPVPNELRELKQLQPLVPAALEETTPPRQRA